MPQPPTELFATWRHSHEEDHDDIEVYRPESYDFPPARGRTGMRIAADGTFVEITIGADDRPGSRPGTWQATDDGSRLNLTREHEMAPWDNIEIVELSDEVLRIRRLGQPGMW